MFSQSFLKQRVTPAVAPGRAIRLPIEEEAPRAAPARDRSSAYSCHIVYTDRRGMESERRVTCLKLSGIGGITHLDAYCHEREAFRQFLISSISAVVDIETGELLDAAPHFAQLKHAGILPSEDVGLSAFLKIVNFMARCDGHFHPMEHEAVEAAITAYCLRFDVADELTEAAITKHRKLAPDGSDVRKAVRRLDLSPIRRRVAKLILDHSGRIMDADGAHHENEVRWAVELSGALHHLAAEK